MLLTDPKSTYQAGFHLAQSLGKRQAIGLIGDLGVGKTHLTTGIAAGLGLKDRVHSPSFGIVHEYRDGPVPLLHFDLYRLNNSIELEQIDWEYYIDQDAIKVIEWADKFPEWMPAKTLWFRLAYADNPEHRTLTQIT